MSVAKALDLDVGIEVDEVSRRPLVCVALLAVPYGAEVGGAVPEDVVRDLVRQNGPRDSVTHAGVQSDGHVARAVSAGVFASPLDDGQAQLNGELQ
nr:hypothetical protein [Microbacterium hydrothermale]